MKILITGATGFVGNALVKKLSADKSYEVVTTVRNTSKELEQKTKCFFIGDIDADTRWEKALGSVDLVVHTAARVHMTNEKHHNFLAEFRKINVEGTLNLARQAAKFAVKRFIFISSIHVNGRSTQSGEKFTADDVPSPTTSYATSKMEAEQGLLKIGKETGMEIVIIRPPLVYGKGAKGNFSTLIKLIESRIPLPFASIKNKHSLISIDNLLDLINNCLTNKAAANQIFLVSDDNDLSTADFIRYIEKWLGKSSRLIPFPVFLLKILLKLVGKGDMVQSICGNLQIDISKTKEILGWKPPVSVGDALKKFMNSHLTHPKYRADIDGLRAIAVLAVVIFHAFPEVGTGVFICLDIFFVISGYLISTIIFKSLEKDKFSFSDFYARRIRRIFPSLFIVLFAVYIIGWIFLFSSEFQRLGTHIFGGAFFISNFTFWNEGGYFDTESNTKILLHLWSLGVEEQFYALCPILLWAGWKVKKSIIPMIIILGFGSFAINILYSDSDPNAAYYSLQSRCWEFIIGTALAYSKLKRPDSVYKWYHNIQSLLGIALIIFGIFYIKKSFAFPGWWALLPTVGSALIIAATEKSWFNRTILSNRYLVWFGLISLPLYLWHWPLLSFARIIHGEIPDSSIRLLIIAISVILAWLTYKYIEKPIRFGKYLRIKTIVLFFAIMLIGLLGMLTYFTGGITSREIVRKNEFNDTQLKLLQYNSSECSDMIGFNPMFCTIYGYKENITVAVIGDSIANAMAPGIGSILANEKEGVINMGMSRCTPFRALSGEWSDKMNPQLCPETKNKIYDYILSNPNIKTVILAGWFGQIEFIGIPETNKDTPQEKTFLELKKLMEYDISALQQNGKNVVISYDMRVFPRHAKDCLDRPYFKQKPPEFCLFDKEKSDTENPSIAIMDEYFSKRNDVCVVNNRDILLKDEKYRFFDEENKLLIMDDHHLSPHGAEKLALKIKKSKCYQQIH